MPESLEGVTQKLAGFIGHREAGRIPNLGKAPTERTILAVKDIKDALSIYRRDAKYQKGRLTDNDMNEVTRLARDSSERAAAIGQGFFEKENKKIINPKIGGVEKQEKYKEELAPKPIPVKKGAANETVNPKDVIHEIANFENDVYDKVMTGVLEKHNLRSLTEAAPEIREQIKKEAETQMDNIVSGIGMDYLRGQIPIVGKYFSGKAEKAVKEYTTK